MPFEEITFDKPDFPFKLCTTTFIYPADWVTNARALGRSFDELELLLFESTHPDSLPTPETIRTLAELSEGLEFSWNIHLPIDIHPGHPDRSVRAHAVDIIRQTIDRVAPLTPTTHTLHLPGITGHPDEPAIRQWQERLYETLVRVTESGIAGHSLTVENIPEYPLELALPLIEAFDLEVCLDIGHLLLSRAFLESAFELFMDRITIMHIHGVSGGHDHCALGKLPPSDMSTLLTCLKNFKGTVSLEVFSKEDLLASLHYLQKKWH